MKHSVHKAVKITRVSTSRDLQPQRKHSVIYPNCSGCDYITHQPTIRVTIPLYRTHPMSPLHMLIQPYPYTHLRCGSKGTVSVRLRYMKQAIRSKRVCVLISRHRQPSQSAHRRVPVRPLSPVGYPVTVFQPYIPQMRVIRHTTSGTQQHHPE